MNSRNDNLRGDARVHPVDDERVKQIRWRAEIDGYRSLTLRDGTTSLALVRARADVMELLSLFPQISSSELRCRDAETQYQIDGIRARRFTNFRGTAEEWMIFEYGSTGEQGRVSEDLYEATKDFWPAPAPPVAQPEQAQDLRWCAYGEHVFGEWQAAAYPWKFDRACDKCGFVEKSKAENSTEFRPEAGQSHKHNCPNCFYFFDCTETECATNYSASCSDCNAKLDGVAQPEADPVDGWRPGTCWSAEEKLAAEIVTKWLATTDHHYADLMSMVAEALKSSTTPPATVAIEAAKEIAHEINGGDREDQGYAEPLLAMMDDPSIANEAALAKWVAAIISRYFPVAEQAEVQRITTLLNEYGGQRCTNVCPPGTDCAVAHWCLLSRDNEGDHLHRCAVERLKSEVERLQTLTQAQAREIKNAEKYQAALLRSDHHDLKKESR